MKLLDFHDSRFLKLPDSITDRNLRLPIQQTEPAILKHDLINQPLATRQRVLLFNSRYAGAIQCFNDAICAFHRIQEEQKAEQTLNVLLIRTYFSHRSVTQYDSDPLIYPLLIPLVDLEADCVSEKWMIN